LLRCFRNNRGGEERSSQEVSLFREGERKEEGKKEGRRDLQEDFLSR
jgi:hypothetical protein